MEVESLRMTAPTRPRPPPSSGRRPWRHTGSGPLRRPPLLRVLQDQDHAAPVVAHGEARTPLVIRARDEAGREEPPEVDILRVPATRIPMRGNARCEFLFCPPRPPRGRPGALPGRQQAKPEGTQDPAGQGDRGIPEGRSSPRICRESPLARRDRLRRDRVGSAWDPTSGATGEQGGQLRSPGRVLAAHPGAAGLGQAHPVTPCILGEEARGAF